MDDFGVWLLNVVNVTLGAATLLAVLAVMVGVVQQIVAPRKKRSAMTAELDGDMHRLFGGSAVAHHSSTPLMPVSMSGKSAPTGIG
jgi:hypothetical protein